MLLARALFDASSRITFNRNVDEDTSGVSQLNDVADVARLVAPGISDQELPELVEY